MYNSSLNNYLAVVIYILLCIAIMLLPQAGFTKGLTEGRRINECGRAPETLRLSNITPGRSALKITVWKWGKIRLILLPACMSALCITNLHALPQVDELARRAQQWENDCNMYRQKVQDLQQEVRVSACQLFACLQNLSFMDHHWRSSRCELHWFTVKYELQHLFSMLLSALMRYVGALT